MIFVNGNLFKELDTKDLEISNKFKDIIKTLHLKENENEKVCTAVGSK